MNLETAQKIAKNIKDETDIVVFADILDELGDIRAIAIRTHAKCCYRGKGIIENFAETGKLIKDMKDFDFKFNNPADWKCCP